MALTDQNAEQFEITMREERGESEEGPSNSTPEALQKDGFSLKWDKERGKPQLNA